jgi:hypothetical protein
MIYRKDLQLDEYAPYYERYIQLVDASSHIQNALSDSLAQSISFINDLKKPLDYSYAPNKWSIGQVIQHNIDTERVFAYRALRFLRGDTTALTGFDQDVFVENLKDTAFAKARLIQSLEHTRNATSSLFQEVEAKHLANRGTASGQEMSARAIPFIVVGHYKHHENVILERY